MLQRSRQHAMPADFAALLQVRQRIKEGRIDAPFTTCPAVHCENGWIRHFDFENCATWLTECPQCKGLGRLYLPAPSPFRAWWKRNRSAVKKWGFRVGWALGVAVLVVVLAIELILWMAL